MEALLIVSGNKQNFLKDTKNARKNFSVLFYKHKKYLWDLGTGYRMYTHIYSIIPSSEA